MSKDVKVRERALGTSGRTVRQREVYMCERSVRKVFAWCVQVSVRKPVWLEQSDSGSGLKGDLPFFNPSSFLLAGIQM